MPDNTSPYASAARKARRRRRLRRAGVAVVLLLALLAGAGFYLFQIRDTESTVGEGESPSPTPEAVETSPIEDSPLQEVIAATTDAGVAEVSLQVTANMPPEFDDGIARRRFSGEGTWDPAASLATVDYGMGEVPNAAGFFGHVEDELSVVYSDQRFLVTFPVMAEVLDGEVDWMAYEIDHLGEDRALSGGIGQLREIGLSDPRLGLALFYGASDEGKEGKNGSTVEIDIEQALHRTPDADMRTLLRTLREELEIKTADLTYELDEEGRIESLQYGFSYLPGNGDKEVRLTVVTEVTGFGGDEIEVPTEATVVSYEGYLNR